MGFNSVYRSLQELFPQVDTKSNKKTFLSSMESLMTLMRDVQLQEQAVEEASMDAATGGSNILARHAGEVFGEKAILVTELKELQSRLLSLSNERDKSLAILNENTLNTFLTIVIVSLLYYNIMSKEGIGEISVICQDIRLLKERFDANLPLSESFTSSQTSCKLASSGTSHKTVASDVGSVHGDSSERSKISESLSSKSGHDEEKSKASQNALLDDGWDIFEKDAELNSGVY
ncbi:uncharacterized protein LOC124828984 [Vigna umbellata]|uniref:uncharacterized protein LOC124828984 n=1 Tax=Vigna umbellata TaxID=87088 RepID=UPI001F5F2062|nr:uncharacterized protein LOC124828984 [Vigna umbellata]